MGWLRDRFSRTYAYHYHKKAAQKALKKQSEAAEVGDDVPESGTTFCYERVVGQDELAYQARLQLTVTPDPSERHQYILTGKGTEACTSRDYDDDDKPSSFRFTIRDGRLAAGTGLFYWTESRPPREKHLVVGTLQRDHRDNALWRVDNAYYVKRFDVEKCGVPPDGDIRETILSFTSVASEPERKEQMETTKEDEKEEVTTNAQESTGETDGDNKTDKETNISNDDNDDENAVEKTTSDDTIINQRDNEPSTDRKESESETEGPLNLDESVSGHDDGEANNDNPPAVGASTTTTPEAVANNDSTPGPTSSVPLSVISTSSAQVADDIDHGVNSDINDDNIIADAVPEDCVITSLLPHIREARSLID